MMRLIRVELRRLFSRRLTTLAILAGVIISGLVVLGMAVDAKPPSGAELQMQQQSLAQAQQDWKQNGPQQVKDCLDAQGQQRQSDPKADFGCDHMEPTAENFGKPQPRVAELMPQGLQASSYLLGFIAFILGAGFVAAEFSSGAIGNWLTFEPRRVKVYGSKLIAAGTGALLLGIIGTAIIAGGIWVISDVWGSTALPRGQGGDLVLSGLRVIALTGIGALVGAAAGALLRHTAAVIGVAMGYLVLVEGVFGGFLQKSQPWLVTKNIDAWVAHGTTYGLENCHTQADGNYDCQFIEKQLSFGHGTLYLAIATLVIVLVSGWLFRRRDIS